MNHRGTSDQFSVNIQKVERVSLWIIIVQPKIPRSRCPIREWTLDDDQRIFFTGPLSSSKRLQLGIHIIGRRETCRGHHNNHQLKDLRCLSNELEERYLAFPSPKLVENKLLHMLLNTFDAASLLPELEIDLASGFISIQRLQIRSQHTQLALVMVITKTIDKGSNGKDWG